MQVFTGLPFTEEDHHNILTLNMGVMLTPGYGFSKVVLKTLKNSPSALDNGAFAAWQKGYGFNELPFLQALTRFTKEKIPLEVIAVPDIVAGGMKSYRFSEFWKLRLSGHKNLYLVVQDGMPFSINLEGYTGVFVGGSTEWKWRTVPAWVQVAHNAGKKCHVGRVGTLERLIKTFDLGVDSVDGTNYVRNKAWKHVEEFNKILEEMKK